jgi:hypothetical protein
VCITRAGNILKSLPRGNPVKLMQWCKKIKEKTSEKSGCIECSFSFHLLLHYTQERRAKKLLDFRRVDFPSAVARRSFTLESIRIIPPGNVSSVCV